MRLSEAISLYCDQRKADGYSANTVKNDYHTLVRIMDILGDIEVRSFNATHLDRVIAAESARGLQAGTLNGYISITSAFSRWCRGRGHMLPDQDPIAGRRYRKDPPKKKNYVPISQFPALLDAAQETHYRDRAFIATGLYTMLRASELTALTVGDIDLDSGELYARIFKTSDTDAMPISAELDRELRTYLTRYSEECGSLDPKWLLFPALEQDGFRTWRMGTSRRISKPEDITRRALTKIGFEDKRIGIHVLRRSAARGLYEELLDQGYDGAIREVQAWCHHASVTMTERYLQLELDRERRNKRTRGKTMFPSLASEKVVNIREARHGT